MSRSMLLVVFCLFSALVFSKQAAAADSLKCYAFMGVQYDTVDYNGWFHHQEDNTKVILENSAPITKGQADIIVGDGRFTYDAHLQGDYFRLEIVDQTNGQSNEYFGPSSSFQKGVDTCLFMAPSKDSKIKASWDELEHKIGDVVADSLKLRYLTVQCNIIHD